MPFSPCSLAQVPGLRGNQQVFITPQPPTQSAHMLLNSEVCGFATSTPRKMSWPLHNVCRKGHLQIFGINFTPATLSEDKWSSLLFSYEFREAAYGCIKSDTMSSLF